MCSRTTSRTLVNPNTFSNTTDLVPHVRMLVGKELSRIWNAIWMMSKIKLWHTMTIDLCTKETNMRPIAKQLPVRNPGCSAKSSTFVWRWGRPIRATSHATHCKADMENQLCTKQWSSWTSRHLLQRCLATSLVLVKWNNVEHLGSRLFAIRNFLQLWICDGVGRLNLANRRGGSLISLRYLGCENQGMGKH